MVDLQRVFGRDRAMSKNAAAVWIIDRVTMPSDLLGQS
jgi:hypothetical protein